MDGTEARDPRPASAAAGEAQASRTTTVEFLGPLHLPHQRQAVMIWSTAFMWERAGPHERIRNEPSVVHAADKTMRTVVAPRRRAYDSNIWKLKIRS